MKGYYSYEHKQTMRAEALEVLQLAKRQEEERKLKSNNKSTTNGKSNRTLPGKL